MIIHNSDWNIFGRPITASILLSGSEKNWTGKFQSTMNTMGEGRPRGIATKTTKSRQTFTTYASEVTSIFGVKKGSTF